MWLWCGARAWVQMNASHTCVSSIRALELTHRAADETDKMEVPGDAIGGIVGKVMNE